MKLGDKYVYLYEKAKRDYLRYRKETLAMYDAEMAKCDEQIAALKAKKEELSRDRRHRDKRMKEVYDEKRAKIQAEFEAERAELKEQGQVFRTEFNTALEVVYQFLAQDNNDAISVNFGKGMTCQITFTKKDGN